MMYNSRGEQKIAEFLNKYEIPYKYQSPLLINDRGYNRIWYPDFHLPRYSTYIEYFGIEKDPIYDERTKHKLETYRNNDIAIVPVYPKTLKGNYEGYILKEIQTNLDNKKTDLEERVQRYQQRSRFYNPIFRPHSIAGKGGYR